jgi:hypothetical protein
MKNSLKLAPWLIAIAVSWSLGYYYNVVYGGGISWLKNMYKQKMQLVEKIDAPQRLIIIGGSGVHYTINAEVMEKELGIPVFNLGLDGKLGLNVIFPSVLPEIRQGDIVLLIPEYLMLSDEDGIGEISSWFGVATGKPGLGGIPPKKLLEDTWLLGVPSLKALTKSGVDLVEKGKLEEYYSDPISERGDPSKTWTRKSDWWKLPIDKPISPHSLATIRDFQADLQAKGATLVIALSWIYGSDDPETIKNIQTTANELKAIAPVLYDPESLNIKTDSGLFADTHYHLKPEARIIRSQQLVKQLLGMKNTL